MSSNGRNVDWDAAQELAAEMLKLAIHDLRNKKYPGVRRQAREWLSQSGTDSPELWLAVCGLDDSAFRQRVEAMWHQNEQARLEALRVATEAAATPSGAKAG